LFNRKKNEGNIYEKLILLEQQNKQLLAEKEAKANDQILNKHIEIHTSTNNVKTRIYLSNEEIRMKRLAYFGKLFNQSSKHLIEANSGQLIRPFLKV